MRNLCKTGSLCESHNQQKTEKQELIGSATTRNVRRCRISVRGCLHPIGSRWQPFTPHLPALHTHPQSPNPSILLHARFRRTTIFEDPVDADKHLPSRHLTTTDKVFWTVCGDLVTLHYIIGFQISQNKSVRNHYLCARITLPSHFHP